MGKIYCPKCKRVLGDTLGDFDGNMNCKNCKTVRVKIRRLEHPHYLGDDNGTDKS